MTNSTVVRVGFASRVSDTLERTNRGYYVLLEHHNYGDYGMGVCDESGANLLSISSYLASFVGNT